MTTPRLPSLALFLAFAGSGLAQEGAPPSVIASAVPPGPVRLEQVRASVRIADGAATTELEQVFRNPEPVAREEVFLLPLPEDSVVSDLTMTVDGKVVKGEMLDRGQARAVYEGIVRARRDPALLEWIGRSCVRLSAFPVPPNGESRVTVRYASVVPFAGGAFEFRLPLALGPVAKGELKSLVVDASVEFSKPIGAIYSPTHPVEVLRSGERSARVTMEGAGVHLDHDLRLLVSLAEKEIGFLFLPNRREGEDGTFLALLAPRLELEPGKVLPKDVAFVLDASGSMAGEKIEQAKAALLHALGRLNPGDRFHLVRFSTEAEPFREGPVPGTSENLEAARAWIAAIEARGGTNFEEALRRGLALPREEGRVPMVFLLTDGLPTVGNVYEKTLLEDAFRRNEARARIFVFGVGLDVNTRLLDTLAEETRAAREYVGPGEAIDRKVAALVEKVSSPVLSDPTLAFEGAEFREVYPKRLPDLFRGAPLVLAGRFRGEGAATVRLRGRFGEGEREWTYALDLPRAEARNESVRATWASRKVGYLLDEIRLHGENAELVEEVKRLSREHGIVTPFTSYLVQEDSRRLAAARGLRVSTTGFLPSGGFGGVLPGTPGPTPPGPGAPSPGSRMDRDAVPPLSEIGKVATGEKAVEESLDVERLKTEGSVDLEGQGDNYYIGARPFSSRRIGGGSSGTVKGRAGGGGGGASDRYGRPADSIEASLRRVGGKLFHLVGAVWIDSSFTEKDRERIVAIEFLSEAYFALLAREPELAAILALGPRVLVAWKGTIYEVK